ncbi:MAG: hypothetical protein ABR915_11200 [Thermoguttaceae bacterium]|jgi:hypothetical protein
MTWEQIVVGVIACAVFAALHWLAKRIPALWRLIVPWLGKRVIDWQRKRQLLIELSTFNLPAVTLHVVKLQVCQTAALWSTVVALTGLVLYEIAGSWTMLSSIVFIVGLANFLVCYTAQIFAVVNLYSLSRHQRARLKAIVSGLQPQQIAALSPLLGPELASYLSSLIPPETQSSAIIPSSADASSGPSSPPPAAGILPPP